MWKGQFNAILVLMFFGGLLFFGTTDPGNEDAFGNVAGFVFSIWVLGVIANLISKALFGFPLLYSRKHITKRTDDGSFTRES